MPRRSGRWSLLAALVVCCMVIASRQAMAQTPPPLDNGEPSATPAPPPNPPISSPVQPPPPGPSTQKPPGTPSKRPAGKGSGINPTAGAASASSFNPQGGATAKNPASFASTTSSSVPQGSNLSSGQVSSGGSINSMPQQPIALGSGAGPSAGPPSGLPSQGAPGHPMNRRPYRLPGNLQQYLRQKYAHVEESLVSTLQETPDGPLGSLNVRMSVVPQGPIPGGNRDDRARSAALAFIAQESELLDLADLSELREVAYTLQDDGTAVVHYARAIHDLPLAGWDIRVDVGADDTIRRVYASLTPSPAALYEAAGRKTLSKEEIVAVIERDLTRDKHEPARISAPNAASTWRAPYVVWGATGSLGGRPAWAYTLDAFTGKILSKGCTAIPVRAVSGATPCD